MKACTRVGFPICLDNTLLRIFGANGKKLLDSIVMDDSFDSAQISSQKDISKFYDWYPRTLGKCHGR